MGVSRLFQRPTGCFMNDLSKVSIKRIEGLEDKLADIYAKIEEASSKGTAHSVGEVFWSQSSAKQDNPGSLPLFTGENVAVSDYSALHNFLLRNSALVTDETTYNTLKNNPKKDVPYYLIKNGRIYLPILRNFIKATNTTTGITEEDATTVTEKEGELTDHFHFFGNTNSTNNAVTFGATESKGQAPLPNTALKSGTSVLNGSGTVGGFDGESVSLAGNLITSIGVPAPSKAHVDPDNPWTVPTSTNTIETHPAYSTLYPWVSYVTNVHDIVTSTAYAKADLSNVTDIDQQSAVTSALESKQDVLPEGTPGYYLQKTETGVQWAEVKGSGGGGDPVNFSSSDTASIVKASDGTNQVSVTGVNTKSGTVKYDWEGTQEQYQKLVAEGSINEDWYYHITDDVAVGTPLNIIKTVLVTEDEYNSLTNPQANVMYAIKAEE